MYNYNVKKKKKKIAIVPSFDFEKQKLEFQHLTRRPSIAPDVSLNKYLIKKTTNEGVEERSLTPTQNNQIFFEIRTGGWKYPRAIRRSQLAPRAESPGCCVGQ